MIVDSKKINIEKLKNYINKIELKKDNYDAIRISTHLRYWFSSEYKISQKYVVFYPTKIHKDEEISTSNIINFESFLIYSFNDKLYISNK